MLAEIFNRFKNRQLLRAFECRDGDNTGYSLTLEIKTLHDANPRNEMPGFAARLKEVPWSRSSIATDDTLVGAHDLARGIEVNTFKQTGKVFDVFIKPEGSQYFYGGNNLLLGLSPGSHQILLLPKGTMPKDGIRTMTPRDPMREAFDVPRRGKPSNSDGGNLAPTG